MTATNYITDTTTATDYITDTTTETDYATKFQTETDYMTDTTTETDFMTKFSTDTTFISVPVTVPTTITQTATETDVSTKIIPTTIVQTTTVVETTTIIQISSVPYGVTNTQTNTQTETAVSVQSRTATQVNTQTQTAVSIQQETAYSQITSVLVQTVEVTKTIYVTIQNTVQVPTTAGGPTVSVEGPTVSVEGPTVSVEGPTVSVEGPTVSIAQPTTVIFTPPVSASASVTAGTLTGLVLCPSRTVNPTYTTSGFPDDYTWGCPPGLLCKPKQVNCNFERDLPADSYYCSPDECVKPPPLPAPSDLDGYHVYSCGSLFTPSPSYFNFVPTSFGYGGYTIFAVDGQTPTACNSLVVTQISDGKCNNRCLYDHILTLFRTASSSYRSSRYPDKRW